MSKQSEESGNSSYKGIRRARLVEGVVVVEGNLRSVFLSVGSKLNGK